MTVTDTTGASVIATSTSHDRPDETTAKQIGTRMFSEMHGRAPTEPLTVTFAPIE